MDKLMPYIEELVSMLRSGINFVLEELPAVVQEALIYWSFMAKLGFWIPAVFTTLSIVSIFPIIKWVKSYHSQNDYDDNYRPAIFAIPAFIIFISVIYLFADGLPEYIMSITAPKLFLITKLSEIIK